MAFVSEEMYRELKEAYREQDEELKEALVEGSHYAAEIKRLKAEIERLKADLHTSQTISGERLRIAEKAEAERRPPASPANRYYRCATKVNRKDK